MPDPSFNYIPGVGLVAPLFAFEVNSGGQYEDVNRFVIFGHKTASGLISSNTPTPVGSQLEVDGLCGSGSQLREMYRIAMQNSPVLPVWIVALPETGTAEVRTLKVAPFTGAGVAALEIAGEPIQVSVGASDTPLIVAQNLTAAINAYYNSLTGAQLQWTATAAAGTGGDVGSGIITLTCRHLGAVFSDLNIYVPASYRGNILAQSAVFTQTVATAGVGIPVLTSALAALGDDPADVIVSPWSDPVPAASYYAALNDASGRWSWARQSYGHVWAYASGNYSTLTTLGLTLNDRHLTLISGPAGMPTPGYLNVAGRAALEAIWLFDCNTGNVSRNQSGRIVQGVKGPRDRSTLLDYNGRNGLNQSGISTFKVDAAGNVVVDKTVTTYRLGIQGQPDTVFRDVQSVYQVSGGLRYLRTVLADEQGQKALANTNPGSLAAISTVKDITGSFMHGYKQLCLNGVFDDYEEFVGLLVVVRDKQNRARVNVYCPLERVAPLDIIAANAAIYSQFPIAA